ncbi:DUF4082 domain-containing protein, partial [Streptosporangium sandarakinum]
PGFIRGIRFYKGPQNTGAHTGSLWTLDGQLLGSVTFTGETASGWQQAIFPTPIPIDASTTYVISYHTTSGYYSVTRPYFTTQYSRGRLTALADGAAGGNGVYTYSGTNVFPTSTYKAANYWVDVLFDGTQTPAAAAAAAAAAPRRGSAPDPAGRSAPDAAEPPVAGTGDSRDPTGPSAAGAGGSRDAAPERSRPSPRGAGGPATRLA